MRGRPINMGVSLTAKTTKKGSKVINQDRGEFEDGLSQIRAIGLHDQEKLTCKEPDKKLRAKKGTDRD